MKICPNCGNIIGCKINKMKEFDHTEGKCVYRGGQNEKVEVKGEPTSRECWSLSDELQGKTRVEIARFVLENFVRIER